MTTMQERRGTAAQWVTANTVLAVGQWGVETDTGRGKIGDGTTAWSSLDYANNDRMTTFNNAAYQVLVTDRTVAQIGTLSASRTVTLPAASAVHAGKEVIVIDASGTVTATNTIVIARAGSDTIDGGSSSTITSAYGTRRLISDGSSKWFHDTSYVRDGLFTAKGVVLGASAANTPSALAAGTDGYALGADSTATPGIAWSSVYSRGQEFNAQTGTTYTLVAGDAGKCVTLTNGSAITLTVPQDSAATLPIGTYVDLMQLGSGQVTVAAGSGATLRVGGPTAKARAQYSRLAVQKISANTWVVLGDLSAT